MNAASKLPETPEGRRRLNRPTYYVLLIVALLCPYGLLLWRLDLSQLPDVDYWFMFLQIWNPDGTLNFPGFFEVWNQHFMVPGKMLYVVNTYLTGGSNYGLVACAMGLSFFCSLIISVFFLKAVPPGFDLARISAVFAIATSMTPVMGSHLFQMGMSGTQWFLANLLAILALAVQNHAWTRQGRSGWLAITLAGFLAFLGCLSYGTGYAILPALIFLAFLARRPRSEILLLLPWLVFSFALFLYAQARPLTEGEITRYFGEQGEQLPAIARIVLIPASLVGGLFTDNFAVSITIALPCFALFAGFLYILFKKHAEIKRLTYFFFGISLFSGGAILVISLARFERIMEFTMTQSRYYSLPALFLLGLLSVMILTMLQYRDRLPFNRVALLAMALPILLAVGILIREPFFWKIHTLQKERGAIYLRLGEVPEDLGIFPQKGQGFEHLYQALSHLNHYPFNDSHPLHAKLGQTLPERRGVLPLLKFGTDPLSENTSKAGGVARLPRGERLEYVYLTDQHGVVIGAAQPGYEMFLDKEAFPADAVYFQGAVRSRSGEREGERVLIYGVLEGQEGVFRIAATADPAPPVPREKG